MATAPISLLAFAYMEYDRRGWVMPDVHVRIYDWMARTEGTRTRVLMVFRGCGKSTILGIRNAHKFYTNPRHQLLVQGADNDLTDDVSRDTLAVLRAHDMTKDTLMEPAGVRHWWTKAGYAHTARTPQFRGRGILSRVTGNRADDIQNDDTEVANNVENVDARAKLRRRLAEQSFILKPDGQILWVGTPHTHDSIYEQKIAGGAEALVIPLFANQTRFEPSNVSRTELTFDGEVLDDGVWVFVGIGASAKLLAEGVDFDRRGNTVTFDEPVNALIDICVGNAMPERFHRAEMLERRRECATVNYWDQQYGLKSKPIHEVRLNPENIQAYDCEPRFTTANKIPQMWLGKVQLVGVSLRWDPSSGKINSDVSGVCLDFQDAAGRHYWHRMQALTGEIAETNEDGTRITGGQVWQLCDLVKQFRIPRVTVETNGIGKLAPSFLRMALKQRQIKCAVAEVDAVVSKNPRILEALEPLIQSRMLWAHVSVLDGELWDQMKDWNPAVREQPDDLLDAGAGAVTDQPARVGQLIKNLNTTRDDDWRPSVGVYESSFDD